MSKKLRLCGYQLPENTILLLEKYAKKHDKPKQVVVNEAILTHVKK